MTNHVKLGATGPVIFPIALGCMGMGGGAWYGASDDAESIATIHAAIERGVTVLDTGDFYGMGKNEMLIGRALAGGRRDKVLLSVKYGGQRDPAGQWLGMDTSPNATSVATRCCCR
jgi:aryl-alcohol dehydrogenase-like predicted oxidoreductase